MKNLLCVIVVLCFVFISVYTQAETKAEPSVKIGNLSWLNDPEIMTYSDADDFCSNLKQDGGGWRLPTMKELQSLFENKEDLSKMKLDNNYHSLWSSEYVKGMRHEVNLLDMKYGRDNHTHDSNGYGLATCVRAAEK